jgi:3-oxoacyl-[acyl-carrier protein] reductase
MHIVITGASQGIGKALAKAFSVRDRINLYLISRSKEKLNQVSSECKELNPKADISIIPFDLDRIIMEDLPPEFDFPRVDILINNAGLLIKKDFLKTEPVEMMDMITTNFLVPACLIRKLANRMGGTKPSHVINLGSMGGFQGSKKFPGLSIYSASKAAIASLTECLASELSDKNIYFNCLAIGAVQTEMLALAFPGYHAPLTSDQMAEFIVDFSVNGYKYMNGKVLPVSLSTP